MATISQIQVGGTTYGIKDNNALPLNGGGIVSGNALFKTTNGDAGVYAEREDTGTKMGFVVNENGIDHGIYSHKKGGWLIVSNGTNVYVNDLDFTNAETARRSIGAQPAGIKTINGQSLAGTGNLTLANIGAQPAGKYTLSPIILWQGNPEPYESITLSQTVANFSLITIIYEDINGIGSSVDVWSPNNKGVCLHTTWINSGQSYMVLRVRWVKISGTTIETYKVNENPKHYGTGQTYLNSSSFDAGDFIKFRTVLGWKWN